MARKPKPGNRFRIRKTAKVRVMETKSGTYEISGEGKFRGISGNARTSTQHGEKITHIVGMRGMTKADLEHLVDVKHKEYGNHIERVVMPFIEQHGKTHKELMKGDRVVFITEEGGIHVAGPLLKKPRST